MNILDTKIQYYPANIEQTIPIGEVSLRDFINSHKNPKENVVKLFKDISEASAKGDKKLKDELKTI